MASKNIWLGVGGVLLLGVGLYLFLSGIVGLILLPVFVTILGAFIPNIMISSTNFWYYIFGGIILFVIGIKLFWDNETYLSRFFVGIIGLSFLLMGLLAGFAGLTEALTGVGLLFGALTILIALLILGFALALIEVGFGFKISKLAKPVGLYTNTLKKLK